MGIKIEMSQRKFRNKYHKAMLNILFTNSWIMDRLKDFIKPEGITQQQYNILRILNNTGEPISTLQLRERMLDRMSDTSRIVNRMITKKLVKKKNSIKDKRLVEISILPQGLEVLRRLDSRIEELDSIIQNLTKKEADIISNLLTKLRNDQ